MKKLSADSALNLLLKDTIKVKEDLERDENRWVKHCIYVAIAAGRIADKLGLDVDYAISLGYIHDIGRKISHPNHTIDGYKYMVEQGYVQEARSCLTHSFIDNNIYLTAGGIPEGQDRFDYMNNFLLCVSLTPYDNIVQMCDLFCLETGFTTIEKRMLDISVRKGIYSNSALHFTKVMELKNRLENQMGCALYDLFPEISSKSLSEIDSDRSELIQMFKNIEVNDGVVLTKK